MFEQNFQLVFFAIRRSTDQPDLEQRRRGADNPSYACVVIDLPAQADIPSHA
jgi:hypothetical protein